MNKPEWLDFSDDTIKKYDINQTGYYYDTKINNISLYKKEYANKNIFVSKKFEVNTLFKYITLTTEELIPNNTDIEYYISLTETPVLSDWIPILPNNNNQVKNERLFFTPYGETSLRFPSKNIDISSIKIYKNNEEIPYEYTIDSNNIIHITIAEYSNFNIYTASYICTKDNIQVDKSSFELKESIEKFNGTDDKGKITLKYPWYSTTDIYNELGLYTEEDSSYDENLHLKINSTDGIDGPKKIINNGEEKVLYKCLEITQTDCLAQADNLGTQKQIAPTLLQQYPNNIEQFTFTPYNNYIKNEDNEMLYPYFEFVHQGNEIYFSEHFKNSGSYYTASTEHGSGVITASYKYIYIPIRIKAILRNNSKDKTITPILKSYKINLY